MKIGSNIPGPGTVGTVQIQDGSVTRPKLVPWSQSDTGIMIPAGGVTAAMIASLTQELVTGALGPQSLAAGLLVDNSLTDTQIAPHGITTASIAALQRFDFLTGSGNFAAQVSGYHLLIPMGGGGGGGGGASVPATVNAAGQSGQGGAGGEFTFNSVALVAGTVYPYVCGAGGAGGAGGSGGNEGSDGSAGGNTTFNGALAAYGGYGGHGGSALVSSSTVGFAANNGGGFGGGQGGSYVADAAGTPGGVARSWAGGGGGGSGAHTTTGTAYNGGAGGAGYAGCILVLW